MYKSLKQGHSLEEDFGNNRDQAQRLWTISDATLKYADIPCLCARELIMTVCTGFDSFTISLYISI